MIVYEWTCGHKASSVCAECHNILVKRASELAAENERLIDRLQSLNIQLHSMIELDETLHNHGRK
jgi:hypothetical protein